MRACHSDACARVGVAGDLAGVKVNTIPTSDILALLLFIVGLPDHGLLLGGRDPSIRARSPIPDL